MPDLGRLVAVGSVSAAAAVASVLSMPQGLAFAGTEAEAEPSPSPRDHAVVNGWDDHGGSAETSTLLAIGQPQTGMIDGALDEDYFRMDLVGSAKLNFATAGPTDTQGELLDGIGARLGADADSGPGGGNFLITAELDPGVYYVVVSGAPGSYALTATLADVADHGDTAATSTLLTLYSKAQVQRVSPSALLSTSARIHAAATDMDMFRLDVPRNKTAVTVRATGSTDTYARLRDSSLDELAMDDRDGAFRIDVQLDSGIYYVEVGGHEAGNYRILASGESEEDCTCNGAASERGTTVVHVDFDATSLGTYTTTSFNGDWPSAEWVSGLDAGRAEIVGGSEAHAGRSLRLKYPVGTYGSRDQAIQARIALPHGYEELYVSYRVRFAEGFDFVKGGKLPGLMGGAGNTGGNRPDGTDGWSGRMMWRRDGEAVQYLYHPDQPGTYGEDLRWNRRFEPGRWHTVEHRFVMNTPSRNDGVLQAWFDGEQTLLVEDLRFRDVDTFAIDHFYISTFFGGGDVTWAPQRDEYVWFDDFVVSTARIRQ